MMPNNVKLFCCELQSAIDIAFCMFQIECGEGTLSFLGKAVTMGELEAHVNRAIKHLELERSRPTRHLGNCAQKKPHEEDAKKYR